MDRSHPLESMRSVIRNALPNITVESINPLPSCRLLRFFSVKVSDGRTLILSLPPPPTQRLLRSERSTNLSETLVTKWLLETVLENPAQARHLVPESTDIPRQIKGEPHKDEQRARLEGTEGSRRDLLRFLPVPIIHSPSSAELGSPFNIFEPTGGVSISELLAPLTPSEKKGVDFQQGQFVRWISGFTSPNKSFGRIVAVLNPEPPSTDSSGTQPAGFGVHGAESWRHTFHSLLEGVLRDAEDMAVAISYEPIRGYFNRLGHFLDGVTTARLVILDASDESNIRVSRSTKFNSKEHDTNPQQQPSSRETERGENRATTEERIEGRNQGGEGRRLSEARQPTISVTGLCDWSNCIFGDPLIAEVFSQGPSSEFLRGFRNVRGLDTSPDPRSRGESESNEDILIEDYETAHIRLLLYECYHATVGVVKQFYRPGPNSSDREIVARKRLAAALRKLEDVDEDAAVKRPRRPSANVEAWPVKKTKGNTDTDTDNRSPSPNAESDHEIEKTSTADVGKTPGARGGGSSRRTSEAIQGTRNVLVGHGDRKSVV